MKATNLPKKIWMNEDWVYQFDDKDFMDEDSVEYVRTDAFIEKATSYIQQHWIWNTKMIEDFKKYMEG